MLFNKKYVICHLRHASTEFVDVHLVVPSGDFITNVGKGVYNLNPAYAVISYGKRLHFVLNENDVVPAYFSRTNSNQEIIIQVKEVKTALENKAYELLYGKMKDIGFIIACLGLLIAIVVGVYAVYTIQNVSPMIEYLYTHPPAPDAIKVIT
jgi:hypothetical protein